MNSNTQPTTKSAVTICLLVVEAVLAAFGNLAAQAQPRGATAPRFEVASVKPSAPIVGERFCGPPRVDPGRLSFPGCTLKTLIVWAYDLKDSLIEGAPGWI